MIIVSNKYYEITIFPSLPKLLVYVVDIGNGFIELWDENNYCLIIDVDLFERLQPIFVYGNSFEEAKKNWRR